MESAVLAAPASDSAPAPGPAPVAKAKRKTKDKKKQKKGSALPSGAYGVYQRTFETMRQEREAQKLTVLCAQALQAEKRRKVKDDVDEAAAAAAAKLPKDVCKRLRPDNVHVILPVGAEALLQGLASAAELNGEKCKVISYDQDGGRYLVKMAHNSEDKRVRPEHLVACLPAEDNRHHGGAPSENNNAGRKRGRPAGATKSFDKFFEKYSWGKDETPPEGEEQRKALSVQVNKLSKAKSQLEPSDPRRAEAERLLRIMREKAKAAQLEGRYIRNAVVEKRQKPEKRKRKRKRKRKAPCLGAEP
jgi:hypothetical protein